MRSLWWTDLYCATQSLTHGVCVRVGNVWRALAWSSPWLDLRADVVAAALRRCVYPSYEGIVDVSLWYKASQVLRPDEDEEGSHEEERLDGLDSLATSASRLSSALDVGAIMQWQLLVSAGSLIHGCMRSKNVRKGRDGKMSRPPFASVGQSRLGRPQAKWPWPVLASHATSP